MAKGTFVTIPRCYDSHVHWLSTGEVLNLIDLSSVRSIDEMKLRSFKIKPNRGDWILGFGWDQSLWQDNSQPHFSVLDELFPNNPVAFSRVDGHALWVNSQALKLAQISNESMPPKTSGGRVEVDLQGHLTGVFIDAAKDLIEAQIPKSSKIDLKRYLLQGMEVFNKAGFTHIRDVGGSIEHWAMANELEAESTLNLFCEMYFNLDSIEQLSVRIQEILTCRTQPSQQLRVAGLKLYFDGALGSEGAYLSQPYANGKNGIQLFELSKIEEIFHRCWEKNIPIAIHTLGDEAVHEIVGVANRLKERGIEGPLNLEHCEVVRPETISWMRALNVRCHLQPSHFLSDRRWLKGKLGDLYKFCFPWRGLIEGGIPINFGSDSPIEMPSLINTQRALETASQEGIALPPISPWSFHSHPDGTWGRNCVTRLDAEGHIKVTFSRD